MNDRGRERSDSRSFAVVTIAESASDDSGFSRARKTDERRDRETATRGKIIIRGTPAGFGVGGPGRERVRGMLHN